MIAGTIVTLVSLPIYSAMYRIYGAMGLVFASDIGIALQTLSIAVLLHRRRMVSLASLDYAELGRCLTAALSGGAATFLLVWALGALFGHLPIALIPNQARWTDLFIALAGIGLWLFIAKWILEKTGSALPRVTMRRLGLA
jgi:putative peptidoglycan lipid II flippase